MCEESLVKNWQVQKVTCKNEWGRENQMRK